MNRHRLAVAMLLGAGLALAGAVAQSVQARAPQDAVPSHPAPAPAPADDVRAQALLANVCTACHDLGILTARPHPAAEWPGILDQMVANGANLSEPDYKILQAYLTRTYSPPAAAS